MSDNQQPSIVIRNRTRGGMHSPAGHDIKVTVVEGWRRASYDLPIDKALVVLPKTNAVTLEFKSKTIKNFKSDKFTLPNAKQSRGTPFYVAEDKTHVFMLRLYPELAKRVEV